MVWRSGTRQHLLLYSPCPAPGPAQYTVYSCAGKSCKCGVEYKHFLSHYIWLKFFLTAKDLKTFRAFCCSIFHSNIRHQIQSIQTRVNYE